MVEAAHNLNPQARSLTEREMAILDFEKSWWQARAPKATEIRERFNLSAARYYQLLNALIDRPEALEHDPLLVKRLRRLREQRQRTRSASRLANR